ncbi:thiamine phosphate synthase [Mariniflexile ostreae]|uniref:Thiamine-phosphate synthase n=1 Tax=Mariniflexile ostreae TaxID=1520892 RepID=A0ABV5FBL6_9FLAO
MIAKLHYISQGHTPEAHLEHITNACASGAELVQLRLKNLDEATLLKTAEKARAITQHYQTRLIINDHYKIAKAVKADGVHLGLEDMCPTEARKHLYSWQSIGGTANTLEACQTLISKAVSYIGLGPFRFTTTKEHLSPVLGLEGYRSILDILQTETPIIAIGGITLRDIPELLKTGVYGVAVSGELTKDFNKITDFKQLLEGSELQEQLWKPNQND